MKLHILYYKFVFNVCTNNDTRIATFAIKKKKFPIGIKPSWVWVLCNSTYIFNASNAH